jgi:hypothetical protein
MSNLRQISGQIFSTLANVFLSSPEPEHETKKEINNLDDLRSFVDSKYIVVRGYIKDVESGEKKKHPGFLKILRTSRLNKIYNKIPFEYWYNPNTSKLTTENGLILFTGEMDSVYDDIGNIYRFTLRGATKSNDLILTGNWASSGNGLNDQSIPLLLIYNNPEQEQEPEVLSRGFFKKAGGWFKSTAGKIAAGTAGAAAGAGIASTIGTAGEEEALQAMAAGWADGTLTVAGAEVFEADAAAIGVDSLPAFGDCTLPEVLEALGFLAA